MRIADLLLTKLSARAFVLGAMTIFGGMIGYAVAYDPYISRWQAMDWGLMLVGSMFASCFGGCLITLLWALAAYAVKSTFALKQTTALIVGVALAIVLLSMPTIAVLLGTIDLLVPALLLLSSRAQLGLLQGFVIVETLLVFSVVINLIAFAIRFALRSRSTRP